MIVLSVIFVVLFLVFVISSLIVVGGFLRGWAISNLWGWFIVPIFHVPELSILQAWGIAMFIGMFTYSGHTNVKKEDGKTDYTPIFNMFLVPILSVVFGYILKSFIG